MYNISTWYVDYIDMGTLTHCTCVHLFYLRTFNLHKYIECRLYLHFL